MSLPTLVCIHIISLLSLNARKNVFLSFLVLPLSGTTNRGLLSASVVFVTCKCLWAEGGSQPCGGAGRTPVAVTLGWVFTKDEGRWDFLLGQHCARTSLPSLTKGLGTRGDLPPSQHPSSGHKRLQSRPLIVSKHHTPSHLLGFLPWDQKRRYCPGASHQASPASQPLPSLGLARLPG